MRQVIRQGQAMRRTVMLSRPPWALAASTRAWQTGSSGGPGLFTPNSKLRWGPPISHPPQTLGWGPRIVHPSEQARWGPRIAGEDAGDGVVVEFAAEAVGGEQEEVAGIDGVGGNVGFDGGLRADGASDDVADGRGEIGRASCRERG